MSIINDIKTLRADTGAEQRDERETKQGLIYTYHHQGRIGVIVEVLCETDFVARTDAFREFTKNVALQVASMNPRYTAFGDIPSGDLIEKRAELRDKVERDLNTVDDTVITKTATTALDKWMDEVILLEQAFVKDPKCKVKELLDELRASVGEKVVVNRFVRLELDK